MGSAAAAFHEAPEPPASLKVFLYDLYERKDRVRF